MPVRQSNKNKDTNGWTDALLEEASSDDDLILTRWKYSFFKKNTCEHMP